MKSSITLVLVLAFLFNACYKDEWKRFDETNSGVSLTSPKEGQVMDNGCYDRTNPLEWAFSWEGTRVATQYHIYVKRVDAAVPIIDVIVYEPYFGFYQYDGYISPPNAVGWKWKVRANVRGEWRPWSEERSFVVEPVDTDC